MFSIQQRQRGHPTDHQAVQLQPPSRWLRGRVLWLCAQKHRGWHGEVRATFPELGAGQKSALFKQRSAREHSANGWSRFARKVALPVQHGSTQDRRWAVSTQDSAALFNGHIWKQKENQINLTLTLTFKTFLITDVLCTPVDFVLSCLLHCCWFVSPFINWVTWYKGSWDLLHCSSFDVWGHLSINTRTHSTLLLYKPCP